jgi:hypothetical protein
VFIRSGIYGIKTEFRGKIYNKMDLNTDAGFMEVRKYRLSNKTLNAREIFTR